MHRFSSTQGPLAVPSLCARLASDRSAEQSLLVCSTRVQRGLEGGDFQSTLHEATPTGSPAFVDSMSLMAHCCVNLYTNNDTPSSLRIESSGAIVAGPNAVCVSPRGGALSHRTCIALSGSDRTGHYSSWKGPTWRIVASTGGSLRWHCERFRRGGYDNICGSAQGSRTEWSHIGSSVLAGLTLSRPSSNVQPRRCPMGHRDWVRRGGPGSKGGRYGSGGPETICLSVADGKKVAMDVSECSIKGDLCGKAASATSSHIQIRATYLLECRGKSFRACL